MTRLPLRLAMLTAVSILAAAPAAASTTMPEAASATADAPVLRSVAVEGGRIQYQVIGDLSSGTTPVLMLHGAFMAGEGMRPLADQFASDRTVIIVDQRNHGRSGDLSGPFTYEQLGDDAAAVLADAGVSKADVVGYSMGGAAALQLALRHPERVDHLVTISIAANDSGPAAGMPPIMPSLTPEQFAGSALESTYKRLSPTPGAFPSLVGKINAMSAAGHLWPDDDIRALKHPTFVIVGDYDVILTENAVQLYRLRGGGDPALVYQPFLTAAPPARLAILPATSHIGVLSDPVRLSTMIHDFLNDETPPRTPGFF